ncbi:MAG: SPFH domain-containing protein, partial [Candidatus Methylomirabilales bacterium]
MPGGLISLGIFPIVFLVVLLYILASAIRVLKEYERAVIFRLGRLVGAKGPGLILLIPFIDQMVRVSLRIVAMDVPSQDVITKDNVSVKVSAVIYFRVVNPESAVVEVEDFLY